MNTLSTLSLMYGKRLFPMMTRQSMVINSSKNIQTVSIFLLKNPYYLSGSRFYSSSIDPKKDNIKDVATETKPTKVKEPLMKRIKHEINHYVNGTKLLGYEIKISTKLLIKFVQGYELSRREFNQLKRTMGDVFRLVPFSAFIVVPFAELLLPIALKIFPNLLPSTYESGKQKQQKTAKLIEIRKKTSNFIHETLEESQLINYNSIETAEKKKTFLNFFRKIYNNDAKEILFTHDEIKTVARMFKNDTVLDNLSRPQLMAMSKFMSLRPFGNDNMLRYQIRFQLKRIIDDDKTIDYEGIDSLTKDELYQACVSRGMKSYGVSEEELKNNLKIWLELRLKEKIPSVLMVLSSTFTFGGLNDNKLIEGSHLKVISPETVNIDKRTSYDNLLNLYYDGILHVLSSIPDPVYNVTKLDVAESKSKPTKEEILTPEIAAVIKEAAKTEVAKQEKVSSVVEPVESEPIKTEEETAASEKETKPSDDNEFKLNVLKEQEAMIKQEAEDAKKRQTADKPVVDHITLDKDDTPTVPPVPLDQTAKHSIAKK